MKESKTEREAGTVAREIQAEREKAEREKAERVARERAAEEAPKGYDADRDLYNEREQTSDQWHDKQVAAKPAVKDGDRKAHRAEEQRTKEAEDKAKEPKLTPEHQSFNGLVESLRQGIVDLQLRPEERKKLEDLCEQIKLGCGYKASYPSPTYADQLRALGPEDGQKMRDGDWKS